MTYATNAGRCRVSGKPFIFAVCLFALVTVTARGQSKSVTQLIQDLRYQDVDRGWTVVELAKRGWLAVDPLIEALKDPAPGVRSGAADALGRIKDSRAVQPLVAVLGDPNAYVRWEAALSLGEIKDPRAVDALIPALNDPDMRVRRDVADALGSIGDARAVQPLIDLLKSPRQVHQFDVVSSAIKSLGLIGSPAIGPLTKFMTETDNKSWWSNGAVALGNMKDAEAVDPLLETLKNSNLYLRGGAATGLGNIGETRAVGPLTVLLNDKESYVRQSALYALGRIGGPAFEPLAAALKDPQADMRSGAARALGDTHDSRAVDPLAAALKDSDARVASDAAKALGKIGPPAIYSLIAGLRDSKGRLRIELAHALGMINDPRVSPEIVYALKTKDLEMLAGAYGVLIRNGEEGCEDALIEALNKHGDKMMAVDFLNCGNSRLRSAAKDWAKQHGYIEVFGNQAGPVWGRH